MTTKLANALVILSAVAALGLVSTSALADSVKDTGRMDMTFTKRDFQPIPDQEGHVLALAESTGNATSSGPLDGFSVTVRDTADLRQGNGTQQGYVIFSKGSDQQVVRFQGDVTTTMKDGQPSTTLKGTYEIVSATGALDGTKGAGTYSGQFTAEDKYFVNWDGMASRDGPRTN